MQHKKSGGCRTKSGMTVKLGLLLASFVGLANAANIAEVPATGPSAADGKQWPTNRFVDDASGNCKIDNLTGLMWSKNGIIGFEITNGGGPIAQPNYANTTTGLNTLSWSQATTAINNMNTASNKLCGYSDWRLPNINELRSLVNCAVTNPAAWLNSNGFSSVQANDYWSSTRYSAGVAWNVYFAIGSSGWENISNSNRNVWPVRGGR